ADLQRALDGAVAGDTIVLTAGTTYRATSGDGSFTLRNRGVPAGQWIVIRSADASFDLRGKLGPGIRATDANASAMPQVRATRNAPAIRAESSAHGYRLIGLDVGADAGVQQVVNMIELGDATQKTTDALPGDIIIDRSYIHGNDSGSFRRGVAMNGANLAVIDSTISNFHDADTDSQAIAGWNGTGPFKIVHNLL